VGVADLVRAAVRTNVPSHLSNEVVAEDSLPLLHAQHEALVRAVDNVLLNAVEACGETGVITATVSARDGEISIAVRDTGVGIEPETLATIFEPYVTSKTGGTGLGLAIVKQTVTAHGGRVEAQSTRGAGTEIRLIFPVVRASRDSKES
jgi:two-component system sensor histidine kinase AtoS